MLWAPPGTEDVVDRGMLDLAVWVRAAHVQPIRRPPRSPIDLDPALDPAAELLEMSGEDAPRSAIAAGCTGARAAQPMPANLPTAISLRSGPEEAHAPDRHAGLQKTVEHPGAAEHFEHGGLDRGGACLVVRRRLRAPRDGRGRRGAPARRRRTARPGRHPRSVPAALADAAHGRFPAPRPCPCRFRCSGTSGFIASRSSPVRGL